MERFKAFKLTETPDKKIRAEFVDYTLEQLDPGDVVVRVAYSDVNYKDALAVTGKGKILRRPSTIGGIDFAGTVVSSTHARWKKGDAVLTTGGEYIGVSHDGGYSPYARVNGDWLAQLPQGMSLWEAMAFGTAGYTAGIALHRMEHKKWIAAEWGTTGSGRRARYYELTPLGRKALQKQTDSWTQYVDAVKQIMTAATRKEARARG